MKRIALLLALVAWLSMLGMNAFAAGQVQVTSGNAHGGDMKLVWGPATGNVPEGDGTCDPPNGNPQLILWRTGITDTGTYTFSAYVDVSALPDDRSVRVVVVPFNEAGIVIFDFPSSIPDLVGGTAGWTKLTATGTLYYRLALIVEIRAANGADLNGEDGNGIVLVDDVSVTYNGGSEQLGNSGFENGTIDESFCNYLDLPGWLIPPCGGGSVVDPFAECGVIEDGVYANLETWANAFHGTSETQDSWDNGILDKHELALFFYALCVDQNTALADLYSQNRTTMLGETQYDAWKSALFGGADYANFLGAMVTMDSVNVAGVAGLQFTGPYTTYAPTKTTTESLSATGDYDGDGVSNKQEYDNVMAWGGTVDDYVEAATSLDSDGTAGELPVAGLAGLVALAVGVVAFTRSALRRRRR